MSLQYPLLELPNPPVITKQDINSLEYKSVAFLDLLEKECEIYNIYYIYYMCTCIYSHVQFIYNL